MTKRFKIPKHITDSPFGKFMFPYHLGQAYLEIPDYRIKEERSDFDIEFNGYFYEFDSDMGDLIMCYLIDKMINQHVS